MLLRWRRLLSLEVPMPGKLEGWSVFWIFGRLTGGNLILIGPGSLVQRQRATERRGVVPLCVVHSNIRGICIAAMLDSQIDLRFLRAYPNSGQRAIEFEQH